MSEREIYYTTPGENGRIPSNPAWGYFPGSVLVYGPTAKADAISLNRILDEGDAQVYRHTIRDGARRHRTIRQLDLGRPIGWSRHLTYPAPSQFATTARAIARNRLRIVSLHGVPVGQQITIMLGKHALWRVGP